MDVRIVDAANTAQGISEMTISATRAAAHWRVNAVPVIASGSARRIAAGQPDRPSSINCSAQNAAAPDKSPISSPPGVCCR